MKDFALLFRYPNSGTSDLSPTEMQDLVSRWQAWIKGIDEQGKLVTRGTRLDNDGKTLRPGGVITDGPFVEIREQLGGFLVVKAENLDEATTLAHGCPALTIGGSVEVRGLL
jgi:hypothetical protein